MKKFLLNYKRVSKFFVKCVKWVRHEIFFSSGKFGKFSCVVKEEGVHPLDLVLLHISWQTFPMSQVDWFIKFETYVCPLKWPWHRQLMQIIDAQGALINLLW